MSIRRILTKPGLNSLRGARSAKKFGEVFGNSLYDLLYLDNKKIPAGFAKSFGNRDCKTLDCRSCGYCRSVAEKAVGILDESLLEGSRKHAAEALDDIRTGAMLY